MDFVQSIEFEEDIKPKLESREGLLRIKEEKIDPPEIKKEPLDVKKEPLDIKEEPLEIKKEPLEAMNPENVRKRKDCDKNGKHSNLFKYDVQVIGDFKLKINGTPTNTPRTLTPTQPVQRISWRASMQLGITPENLLQLQMRSPSPTKNFAPTPIRTAMSNQNEENAKSANKFSPLSSTSLHNLTTSPILNMPVKKQRRQPSKDSLSRPKRRRVSKKLYD